jgi:predicted nucleic acid-binding OB-fold protein
MGKSQTKASNSYHAKVYDSIRVQVRKGDREKLHEVKTQLGYESINDMVLSALEDKTGLKLRLGGDKD